jgi:hypothetical protein
MADAEWTLTGALQEPGAAGIEGYSVLDARSRSTGTISGRVYAPDGRATLIRITRSSGSRHRHYLLPLGAISYIDDDRRRLGLRLLRGALSEAGLRLNGEHLPPMDELKILIRYAPNPSRAILTRLALPTAAAIPKWAKLSEHTLPVWHSLRDYEP